ncbi:hypothetical protein AB4254_11410 [Vibrio breoganii]
MKSAIILLFIALPTYALNIGDCTQDWEGKVSACVTILSNDLSCHKSYDKTHFDNCSVKTTFSLKGQYNDTELTNAVADVKCSATILRKGSDNFEQFESVEREKSLMLTRTGSQTLSFYMDYNLFAYRPTSIKFRDSHCDIKNISTY